MRSSFRIGITVFLWLTSFLLAAVFLLICLSYLSNTLAVRSKVAEVRQVKLPEAAETQRSFINIESLRRLAEVVYISENPQARRNARIKAQALSNESIFTRNKDFYDQAQGLSARINALAACRDEAQAKARKLRQLGKDFLASTYRLAALSPEPTRLEGILKNIYASSLYQFGAVGVSGDAAKKLRQMNADDAANFAAILRICSEQAVENPALAPLCEGQKRFFEQYSNVLAGFAENMAEAHAQWDSVDQQLREMRDAVRTGAEVESQETLTTIESSLERAALFTACLAGGGMACFLLYLAALHWFLVRPVRWTGLKLAEIQHGVLDSPAPKIHIRELFQVGDLLDRFSVHIAELTTHASQLAEDAAEKKDLEALMTAVFQVSVEGYCLWSPGKLHTANAELLKMLGLKDVQELYLRWRDIGFTPFAQQQKLYEEVIAQGFVREELYLNSIRGEAIPFEVSYLPIKRQDGIWALAYFRDLRQQKLTEHTLRVSKEQAEEAARVKSEFLARMSHEIRTPMNGVLGLTHLALEDSPPPAQKSYLQKIQASARILLRVINDILDFSKMESGRFALDHAPFSFSRMLTTVFDLFTAQARDKKLSFRIESDPNLPDYVAGDELRLSQVLLNLCGNAVKFTEQGEVTLKVSLDAEYDDILRVRFSIRDTGVGMTERQLALLFEPFAQVDTSTTRKYGGTGLGLVISKLLIEMMQGRIVVESEQGKGSTFTFYVFLERCLEPPQEARKTQDEANETPALQGLRILLAEDNEINQEVAVALLTSLGCETVVASNGAEALCMLEEREIDGVLMDIQMPLMDGLTATKAIRESADARLRSLPIIAMTAHALQEDREKSLAAGMDEHITKPIDINELCTVLLRLVANKGTRAPL